MSENYVEFLIRKLDDLNTSQDMADYYLDEIFDYVMNGDLQACEWLFKSYPIIKRK